MKDPAAYRADDQRCPLVTGQAGRHDEVHDLIGRTIARRDDEPSYYYNLGNALRKAGRPAEAAVQYRRALVLEPDHALAHSSLGAALLAGGEPDEAITHLKHAIALRPDLAEAHNNLALALQGKGRAGEAIAHFEQALALRPDWHQTHNNLGNALAGGGQPEAAIAHYRQALALTPDYAEAHNNLAAALHDQGRFDDAKMLYARALVLNPDYAEAHNNLGNTLLAEGLFTEAMTSYARAVDLKPAFAQAHHNLGIALQHLGAAAQAQQAYEMAVALAPRAARFHLSLTATRRTLPGDRYLLAMETLANDIASLPAEDQTELHFALGKAYADLGQHERSFCHLLAGNTLKRRATEYDEAAMLGLFERVQRVFTSDLMRQRRGVGDPSAAPVFIIGMARSGTTLVEQILASHNAVFGGGELDDFSCAVNRLAGPEGSGFPELVPALPAAALRQLGTQYVAAVSKAALGVGSARFTDKMPGNFVYAGLIHLALPRARIIHVRRDPLDTCFSCFAMLFAAGQRQSYDLAELGRYYRAYARLMAHWRRVLPPGGMLEVDYEDLVADPERQARRIVEHCGLAWDAACLDFYNTRRPVLTASAMQVRRPIYRSSIGRSRAYAPLLEPLIRELAGAP